MQFYKPALFILFLATVSCTVFSQTNKAIEKLQPVTDSVTAAMCNCISVNKDSIATQQQLFTQLQNCLQKYSVPKIEALLKEDGFVQEDDRKTRALATRAIGQKLGKLVVTKCAVVKELMTVFANETPKPELH